MNMNKTRILIVDDKEESLYLLLTLLRGSGYEVDEAHHGAEALIRARQAPPDLIISDLLMPVMDGYTLLRYWRADERLKSIPFVVYTATYTEAKDERLALDLGADGFILKPAEPELFMERIHDLLSKTEHGGLSSTQVPKADEATVLKEYSEVLIRKLEEKALQLEEANRTLQQDIAARKRVEELINASLKEKEVLLQEIHHRVKNNLQIISGLLTMQAGKVSDATSAEIFRESQDRIRSIALIHEKLYSSHNLAEIDFSQYLHDLTGNIFSSHGITSDRISARFETEPIRFTIEVAMPLGLIANELVTNALKHAYPEERPGEIHISLNAVRGTACELTVADNGVGLPEEFKLEDQKTLGMHLVRMLTTQLGGSLTIEQGNGAVFRVTFPKDEKNESKT